MNRLHAILLVEDNPDDEALTVLALRRSNVANEIVVARNGAEALDRLLGPGAESEPLPAMILLDLKLPKIDGLEVLRRVREHERTRLIPVIILTTSSEDQDIVQSYRSGANSYVRKPVDFDQFVEAVRQLGLYWLVINQRPPDIRLTD
jgi:two-component system response regulator